MDRQRLPHMSINQLAYKGTLAWLAWLRLAFSINSGNCFILKLAHLNVIVQTSSAKNT